MTSQKTISAIGVVASTVAAGVTAWNYAQTGDPYYLAAAIFSVLASVIGLVNLRSLGPSNLASFKAEGAMRTVAQFVGFAAACWLVILVRLRSDDQPLLDPINAVIVLMSLVALVLAFQVALQLRESKRVKSS